MRPYILVFPLLLFLLWSASTRQSTLFAAEQAAPDREKFRKLEDLVKEDPERAIDTLDALMSATLTEERELYVPLLLARAYRLVNQVEKAIPLARQVLQLARQRQDIDNLFFAFDELSQSHKIKGQFVHSAYFARRGLNLAEEQDNDDQRLQFMVYLVYALIGSSQYDEAFDYLESALTLAR